MENTVCKDGCEKGYSVVNKRYSLCQWCNHIRLHGKTIYQSSFSNKVNKISSKKKYKCSDGTSVSQKEISENLSRVKREVYSERENKCEGLENNRYKLSISHTISVDRCKKLGKSELIWDKRNMFIEGFHERCSNPIAAHNIWEDGKIKDKLTLLNFDKKMLYLQEYDIDTYNKYLEELKQ